MVDLFYTVAATKRVVPGNNQTFYWIRLLSDDGRENTVKITVGGIRDWPYPPVKFLSFMNNFGSGKSPEPVEASPQLLLPFLPRKSIKALKFSPYQARWIRERQWHKTQKLTELDEGGVIMEMDVQGLDEVKRWVMQYGTEVEVLGPEELRKNVKQEIGSMVRLYELTGE